ncbi:hypothetical protein NECAME_09254 [Necator americanus]|uniref:Uncharacterized protein n=1 Tax=Necator americanus TaxID=51031 RepID=W2TE87_NECAM|nr:hypothetical protein NECAME_09254 [Necator americanus]ETN80360.1 hypothetical protein NECAME_09254 [Necator americanus]
MLLDELFPSTYETSVRPGSNDSATVVTIVPNKLVLLYMDQLQETIQFSEEFLLVSDLMNYSFMNLLVEIQEKREYMEFVDMDRSAAVVGYQRYGIQSTMD